MLVFPAPSVIHPNQMSHGCPLKRRCKDICCSVSGMVFDRRLLFLPSLVLLLTFLLLKRIIVSPYMIFERYFQPPLAELLALMKDNYLRLD
jgi:hypothetical protein